MRLGWVIVLVLVVDSSTPAVTAALVEATVRGGTPRAVPAAEPARP